MGTPVRRSSRRRSSQLAEARSRGMMPRLALAEMFERYRIPGKINEAADRAAWEAGAAKDALGGWHRRASRSV